MKNYHDLALKDLETAKQVYEDTVAFQKKYEATLTRQSATD